MTWMRPEPLDMTLQRACRLGYESVELAGEPDRHPFEEARSLLAKYNISCWGTVNIMHGTRDLAVADPRQRAETVEYMKPVLCMASELGGTVCTVVPATVGKMSPSSTPGNEWRRAVEGLR